MEDKEPSDGHNVYMQTRVAGYSWRRLNGVQKENVRLDKVLYDGAAQYTRKAWVRACRDRAPCARPLAGFGSPYPPSPAARSATSS
ncbi:hypothetical protein [Streptomyces sp. H27-C3]|uniref:hypothetical protein n=1 Tax=Streptomyces sp. H27-C3 TaxID=3046305 RepID=UPI0024B8C4A1|nr:hypothetical protein [Streptomyces sp. H27-C3]MDJ0462184.1 hypothetical protein [Streptomyces sp. H27-C3]